MVFRDHASKLLKLSRMAGEEYVPSEEDPDIILSTLVPIAMSIVQTQLAGSTFCDRFSTPLTTVARQVFEEIIRAYRWFSPSLLAHLGLLCRLVTSC